MSVISIDSDTKIVSADDIETIKIWDVNSDECLKTIHNDSNISSICMYK